MHPALARIRDATRGSPFEEDLWLVGGAVRDELLGREGAGDFDIVTRGSASELADLLYRKGTSAIPPVIYERFGTAMLKIEGAGVELVTARRESYDPKSRKPSVEPASLEEDASRRDFTVNALLRNLHTGELADPLRKGLADLERKVLRTPLDPAETFRDDPLRMLRAVRFRWQLGFEPAPGLWDAIRLSRARLEIVSAERIRDELVRMLRLADADRALDDLMRLGLLDLFAPELVQTVGVEQGSFHHLDVWDHTLLVVRNAGAGDLALTLAALLHDIGKPATRTIDSEGNTRFFGHETLGADMARDLLRRLKFPSREVEQVARLVKAHMRLGSSPRFSAPAARRLLRDLGEDVDRLLALVEADAASLRPGVRRLDLAPVRSRIEEVRQETPRHKLRSPLAGQEIMDLLGLPEGPEVGRVKDWLTEQVIEGTLAPDDKDAARRLVREYRQDGSLDSSR